MCLPKVDVFWCLVIYLYIIYSDVRESDIEMEALLIIDMSNDFVDDKGGLTAGKPAQEIVPNIIKKKPMNF